MESPGGKLRIFGYFDLGVQSVQHPYGRKTVGNFCSPDI